MIYFTNRVHGMPTQRLEGNPEKPVINLQWGITPDWLKR